MAITAFFPTLRPAWPVPRAVHWKTQKHEAISGKTTALALWSLPRRSFTLSFEVLQASEQWQEWQQLESFFNSLSGGATPFHYQDPNDYAVSGGGLGTADGVTALWPFVRTLSGPISFVEPIQDVNGATVNIYLDGVLQAINTNYTLANTSPLGTTYAVAFNLPPAAGTVITADFEFYWLCRLDDDAAEFSNFMYQFFELKKLKFTTVKQ